MFTGLIEEIGAISDVDRRESTARFRIEAPRMAHELIVGESVAVDGACLTVEEPFEDGFRAFASVETLQRTTLGGFSAGRRVNVERALRVGDRLGGHLVAGHVDATGSFLALEPQAEGWLLRVSAPTEILEGSVPKGSIAVNGISLTLVEVGADSFSVAVIPQTYHETTLQLLREGDAVNLESDMIGKYVMKGLKAYSGLAGEGEERPATPLEMLLRDRRSE